MGAHVVRLSPSSLSEECSMSISKTSLIAVFSACFGLLVGCASNSNFHSARPLGTGNAQGFFAISHLSGEGEDTTELVDSYTFTTFEIGAMVGLLDGLDIGVKYTFPTAAFLEAKYALIGKGRQRGFFFGPGLRGGYTSFPTDTSEASNNRIEFAVPLYCSLYPTEWFGMSLIPSYSGRVFEDPDADFTHLVGGNVNIDLGKKFGFLAEFSFYRNLTSSWNEMQVGAGIKYELRELF
jgi:hypothetical protein